MTITLNEQRQLVVTNDDGSVELVDAPPVLLVQRLLELACSGDAAFVHELDNFRNRLTIADSTSTRYYDVTITRHIP